MDSHKAECVKVLEGRNSDGKLSHKILPFPSLSYHYFFFASDSNIFYHISYLLISLENRWNKMEETQ